MNSNKYYNDFQERFNCYSNDEIISTFNSEVGKDGWGTARASFLAALHQELDQRNFDYSEIGDSKTLSFKNFIILVGNKISISFGKSV